MDVKEAYCILKLEYGACTADVKNAYRKMALELHPDRNGSSSKFKRLSEAYQILKSAPKIIKKNTPPARKSQWGAPRPQKPPEQDWSKYTKEFEENAGFWTEYERRFWDEYEKFVDKTGSNGEFSKTQEEKNRNDLAVKVEPSLCIGCCSCEIIAPDVFFVDKEKQTNPKSTVHDRRGAGLNKIMNAAETCPTKAISVDDLNTGKRLYPF